MNDKSHFLNVSITKDALEALNDMVPRQEMVSALAEQRRRLSRENDDVLIGITTLRERLWDLFEAASAVDRFDWSSDGIDEDADAAMCRLQSAVRSIKQGVFQSVPRPTECTHCPDNGYVFFCPNKGE